MRPPDILQCPPHEMLEKDHIFTQFGVDTSGQPRIYLVKERKGGRIIIIIILRQVRFLLTCFANFTG